MNESPISRAHCTHRVRPRLVTASLTAAALLSVLGTGSARAQSYPIYTVTSLPVSTFTAFNDSGLILGRAFLPCTGLCTLSDSPVLYDSRTGTLTGLGGGFGGGTQFDAINANGQLAGSSTALDASGSWVRKVVIRQVDGTLTTLAAPPLSPTQFSGLKARGLNISGQIALQHSDGLDTQMPLCGNYQGWIGTGDTAAGWKPLGPAGNVTHLTDINASGVSVGAAVPSAQCGGAGGGFRAVAALPTGTLIDLHSTMPGGFSRANAINDLGYAVGDYDTGARTLPDTTFPQGVPIAHAVVWNTATKTWFDMGLAGVQSRLNAANNRGEVVGSFNGAALPGQPYISAIARAVVGNLATNWPMADLNTLLAQNTDGWVLQDAVAINANGQIVARGASVSGSGYALLTPVTAPRRPVRRLAFRTGKPGRIASDRDIGGRDLDQHCAQCHSLGSAALQGQRLQWFRSHRNLAW
jgi:uncharacterized membrane protein